jgi:uncharacterized DUF497 family protein
LLKITRIIWLHEYVTKIETKHHIYRDEVREVLVGNPHVRRVGKGAQRSGEHLYAAYGQTASGRYLVVFFIHKTGNEALVISARDMDEKERKRYGRK